MYYQQKYNLETVIITLRKIFMIYLSNNLVSQRSAYVQTDARRLRANVIGEREEPLNLPQK